MNECPVFDVTSILGKKWTIPLIQEVDLNGEKGFNFVLSRMNKITPKILSNRLKELEDRGIIEKKMVNEGIFRSKYALTQKGKELQEIINSIKLWNMKYSDKELECSDKECIECDLY